MWRSPGAAIADLRAKGLAVQIELESSATKGTVVAKVHIHRERILGRERVVVLRPSIGVVLAVGAIIRPAFELSWPKVHVCCGVRRLGTRVGTVPICA